MKLIGYDNDIRNFVSSITPLCSLYEGCSERGKVLLNRIAFIDFNENS